MLVLAAMYTVLTRPWLAFQRLNLAVIVGLVLMGATGAEAEVLEGRVVAIADGYRE